MKSYVKANLTSSGAVGRTVGGLWMGEASSFKYASASNWNEEYDMRWKKLLRVGLSFSCRKIRSRKQLVNPVSFDHDGASPLRKRKAVGAESKNTVDTVKVTCDHDSHWLQETATRYVASSTVYMSRCQQVQTGRHQVAPEGHRQPVGYTRS